VWCLTDFLFAGTSVNLWTDAAAACCFIGVLVTAELVTVVAVVHLLIFILLSPEKASVLLSRNILISSGQ
jgi:hypothetical protein